MLASMRFLLVAAFLVAILGILPGMAKADPLSDEDLLAAAQLVDSDIVGETLALLKELRLDESDALADALAAPALAAPTADKALDGDADELKAEGPDLDDVQEEVQEGPQDADELEPGTNGPDLDNVEEHMDGPEDVDGPEDADEAAATVDAAGTTVAAPVMDDDATEVKGAEADEPGGLESNHEFEGEEVGEH